MSLPPNSSLTSPQCPPRVRWLFLFLWANLVQATAIVVVEPVSSDARLGLQLPLLLMNALLLVRMMQGFSLARVGHGILTMTLAILNLEPSVLSWYTALSAGALAISAVANWLPIMSLWLAQHAAWRKAIPIAKQRRLARHGLLYGMSWVLVTGLTLVLDDLFNIPVAIEVLTFSLGMLTGWILMGRYLMYLILRARVPPHD